MHECRLKAINRNLTVFNLNATIVYPVYDLTLDMQLFKKANGYKPFLVRNFVDVCQFLKKRKKSYFNVVYNLVKPFSTLNHSCPYEGYILVKDFYIIPEKIGLPAPTGEYLISLKWLYDKKLQITTNFYFTYTEDYIDM
ncbi:uncharacterized protein LOC132793717 [Drosophila nasuta]|uniref:uncharacterized protein LOC132793717 n=1 Tax=Drosophila nasuta TaxID=42062 RepID=UPI00295E5199|nr:uncharacterized protein LOC132793717 [Drosophila nasuta]